MVKAYHDKLYPQTINTKFADIILIKNVEYYSAALKASAISSYSLSVR